MPVELPIKYVLSVVAPFALPDIAIRPTILQRSRIRMRPHSPTSRLILSGIDRRRKIGFRSNTGLVKVTSDQHLDQGVPGHTQSLGFLVQQGNHPHRKVHIDALLLLPGATCLG